MNFVASFKSMSLTDC